MKIHQLWTNLIFFLNIIQNFSKWLFHIDAIYWISHNILESRYISVKWEKLEMWSYWMGNMIKKKSINSNSKQKFIPWLKPQSIQILSKIHWRRVLSLSFLSNYNIFIENRRVILECFPLFLYILNGFHYHLNHINFISMFLIWFEYSVLRTIVLDEALYKWHCPDYDDTIQSDTCKWFKTFSLLIMEFTLFSLHLQARKILEYPWNFQLWYKNTC